MVLCFGGSVLYIRWARDEIQRLRSEHILMLGSDLGGEMDGMIRGRFCLSLMRKKARA